MDYPLSKYKFYEHTLSDGTIEVIAISTYGGKVVKGKAKCHPDDNFDRDKGQKLAALRCNLKIAEKRKARALKCVNTAEAELNIAKQKFADMGNYYADSATRAYAANIELVDFYNTEIKNKVESN